MLCCPWDSLGKNIGVGCHVLLRGSSQSKDQTCVSCIAGRFFTIEPLRTPPIQYEQCFVRRGNSDTERDTRDVRTHTHTQTTWGHSEKTTICKPRTGEASQETKPATTLMLDFLSPELEEKTQLFKPSSLCVVFCYGSPSKLICRFWCKHVIWFLKPSIERDIRSQDKGDSVFPVCPFWSLGTSVFSLPTPHCLSLFWRFLVCFFCCGGGGFYLTLSFSFLPPNSIAMN